MGTRKYIVNNAPKEINPKEILEFIKHYITRIDDVKKFIAVYELFEEADLSKSKAIKDKVNELLDLCERSE